jgi:hypothetical protein
MEISERNSRMRGQLIFRKGVRTIQRQDNLFNKRYWLEKLAMHVQKNEVGYLHYNM